MDLLLGFSIVLLISSVLLQLAKDYIKSQEELWEEINQMIEEEFGVHRK
jgi:hypothetical protein